MTTLLQIDFPFTGPFGEMMSKAFVELAESIAEEPGFIWKIWTENENEKLAGGIYLFATQETAQAYLDKHLARLRTFGVEGARAKLFAVNHPLSRIDHAPLPAAT